jgi:hypothetical protein
MDRSLAQAGARIAYVRFWVSEVTDAPIDVHC